MPADALDALESAEPVQETRKLKTKYSDWSKR